MYELRRYELRDVTGWVLGSFQNLDLAKRAHDRTEEGRERVGLGHKFPLHIMEVGNDGEDARLIEKRDTGTWAGHRAWHEETVEVIGKGGVR